jgi:SAM-dependent methyltransferase
LSKGPVLDSSDAERVIRGYRERIAQHGPTLASLNSGDEEKQRLRHQVHASALVGDDPSILDIGCGLASFYASLQAQGKRCRYTGFDIVPEYIEFCRVQFPGGRFELRNVFEEGIDAVYDSVIMSQAFNNRYTGSDNVEVVKAALRLAYDNTLVSVSLDMLSDYAEMKRDTLFYYSPQEMFGFARTLAPRVILRHDYRSSEFCIQLFHESAPGYAR